MKKIIFILFMFSFISSVSSSEFTDIYISKRDIDTKEFITDCDFLLYDSNNNIVASWVATDQVYHISNVKKGTYSLVERPLILDTFSDDLSKVYKLDIVSDEIMEITLYNKKIETPRNLNINSSIYLIGFLFIFCGLFIIIRVYRHFYLI